MVNEMIARAAAWTAETCTTKANCATDHTPTPEIERTQKVVLCGLRPDSRPYLNNAIFKEQPIMPYRTTLIVRTVVKAVSRIKAMTSFIADSVFGLRASAVERPPSADRFRSPALRIAPGRACDGLGVILAAVACCTSGAFAQPVVIYPCAQVHIGPADTTIFGIPLVTAEITVHGRLIIDGEHTIRSLFVSGGCETCGSPGCTPCCTIGVVTHSPGSTTGLQLTVLEDVTLAAALPDNQYAEGRIDVSGLGYPGGQGPGAGGTNGSYYEPGGGYGGRGADFGGARGGTTYGNSARRPTQAGWRQLALNGNGGERWCGSSPSSAERSRSTSAILPVA